MCPDISPASGARSSFILSLMRECPVFHITGVPPARVIASVGSFGPFSIMDLARHANLDKSQASRAAEALSKQGLVMREASEDDGRVVLVSLTPEGRALYRRVMPVARKWNEDFFACLDENEQVSLSNALDKVIQNMQVR